MRTIELGGGTNPLPDSAVVIDIHHPVNSPAQDAAITPWISNTGVIEDSSFDRVYCSHFLEHIPSGQPRINVFNEAWRVLRSGGVFDIVLPLVGWTDQNGHGQLVNGWMPYADPTHVSSWWFPESLLYFCEGPFKPHAEYGIKTWAPLGQLSNDPFVTGGWTVLHGFEGRARLVKP
jgi:SAM-dependent methyltransferase